MSQLTDTTERTKSIPLPYLTSGGRSNGMNVKGKEIRDESVTLYFLFKIGELDGEQKHVLEIHQYKIGIINCLI